MDREAWRDVFHEVTKTWTPLSNRTDSELRDMGGPRDCIQGEVSKKEKNIVYKHICVESRKMV